MDIAQLITYISIFISGLAVGIPSAKKILENLIKAAESKAAESEAKAEKAKLEAEKAKKSSQAAGELAISAESTARGNSKRINDLYSLVETLQKATDDARSDADRAIKERSTAENLYTEAVTRMVDERQKCDEKIAAQNAEIACLVARLEESEKRHEESEKRQAETDLYVAALHEQLNALGQQPVPRARRKTTKDLETSVKED